MCKSSRSGFALFLNQRMSFHTLTRLLGLSVVLLIANAAAAQQDLAALFDEAAQNFKQVTENELNDARAELETRMKELERFVRPSSQNGQRWLRYLKWEDLKNALAADGQADPRALRATLQRLNRDETGLEAKPFRRMADALHKQIQLSQMAQQPDQQKYYRDQLDALQKQLADYRNEPNAATSYQIGARLRYVSDMGGGRELVKAVRREFARPNAYMYISTNLIAAGVDPINRREPVTDCILGTSIRSDARTRGTVGVATIPSEDKAVLEFISEGRTRSHNVGHNGPAVIRSNAETDFTATKRVELSDPAFVGKPSRSHATTDTHIYSTGKSGGGFGSRIVSNIAWKRAHQSERQAERIAADHAEDRIDRRFDQEVNDEIRDARKRYEDEYRRPLERRDEVPDHIHFSSTKDSVNLEVAQANRSQLAAPGDAPEAPAGHDLGMRLHESAVNNYSASLLSGATASETEPGQDVKFDVKLPKWMKDAWENRKTEPTDNGDAPADEGFKPYALTFREGRPLSVDFDDSSVKLTIHIARLKSGDKTFRDWDVTGIYKPERVDGGVVLRRDDDLVMLPANFRGALSPRQTAERRNLEEELNARSAQGRGFPKSFELEPLEPEGNLADAGPLDYQQFDVGNGWAVVAWDRRQK
jgi:hypothetical protein